MSQTQKWYTLRRSAQKLKKKHIFPLMITYYNLTLKMETSCKWSSFCKLEMAMTLLCMFGLFILG